MGSCVTMEGAPGLWYYATKLAAAGDKVSPRKIPTREARNVILRLRRPEQSLLTTELRPGYHPAIGIAEGLMMIAGYSDAGLMQRIAPAFEKLREPDGRLHGAYGDRLNIPGGPQLQDVITRLRNDRDSRQAVCTIWDPAKDYPREKMPADVPCTVDLLFSVRDRELLLDTHMRSEDVWLGLPYDLIQFTMVQLTIARILGMKAGTYTHYVNSFHVYERDVSKLPKQLRGNAPSHSIDALPATEWDEAQQIAWDLLHGQPTIFEGFEPSEFTKYCEELLSRYVND